jgi:hypothetical protein
VPAHQASVKPLFATFARQAAIAVQLNTSDVTALGSQDKPPHRTLVSVIAAWLGAPRWN